jgi:hypothetical protein
MHLDRGFVLAKFGPGKQREAKIDGGRIQSVQILGSSSISVQRGATGHRQQSSS